MQQIRQSLGRDLHTRAEKILALQGIDPAKATAEEYEDALREAGDYSDSVFVDRLAAGITADVENAVKGGYVAAAAVPGSDAVDVERIVKQELGRLSDPLPPGVAAAGPKGIDLAVRRLFRDQGITEFDERAYTAAVRQVLRDLQNPKRKV
jgi:hypothetical protein